MLTQRLLILVVLSVSVLFLLLFLPFPLGIELDRLSVGVESLSSDFIGMSMFMCAIFGGLPGAGRAQQASEG